MNRSSFARLALAFAAAIALPAWSQQAVPEAAPAASGPALKLPVPRTVRAAQAAVGLGRQRLALVIGNGPRGNGPASEARDAKAVADALRAAGFVVMVREDLGVAELRAALAEFHVRLQPGGVGFLYCTGQGAQVDGRNYLLVRGLNPDAAAIARAALPMDELADAVQGPADSARFLVVDAAFAAPALAALPHPGLAEPRIAPGLMAMFSALPGASVEPAPVAALPDPPPADPRRVAASVFGRELVRAITTPRLSGPEVLRKARGAVLDASAGRQTPWIAGDSTDKDELADPTLIDSLVPQTPGEAAETVLKQMVGSAIDRRGAELPVSEVLAQPSTSSQNNGPSTTPASPPRSQAQDSGPGAADAATQALSAATTVAGMAAAAAAPAEAAAGAAGTAVAAGGVAAGAAHATIQSAGALEQVATAALTSSPKRETAAEAATAVTATTLAAAAAAPAAPAAARPAAARPVAPVLRTNPYGYTAGDSFSYRVLDTWKGEALGSMVQTIDAVADDGSLSVNGGETLLDAQGRVRSTRDAAGTVSRFEPCQDLWWSKPRPGQERDVKFVETTGGQVREWKGTLEVGRARSVDLPAGRFDVLPIEGHGWTYTASKKAGALPSRKWKRTVWYAPSLGHPVAIDLEDTDSTGRLLMRQRIELEQVQSARSRP